MRDVVLLDGFNVVNAINQSNTATAYVILDDWSARREPKLRAAALAGRLQDAISADIRDARATVLQPPPILGLSQTGGVELMIEDREGRGVEALARVADRFLDEARDSATRARRGLHHVLGPRPPAPL